MQSILDRVKEIENEKTILATNIENRIKEESDNVFNCYLDRLIETLPDSIFLNKHSNIITVATLSKNKFYVNNNSQRLTECGDIQYKETYLSTIKDKLTDLGFKINIDSFENVHRINILNPLIKRKRCC